MSRKPAALPDIEDATFAACLAPLAEAVASTAVPDSGIRSTDLDWEPADSRAMPSGSADLAYPGTTHRPRGSGMARKPRIAPVVARTPHALAEWRSLADEEYAEFCAIDLFLAKTDAELCAAAAAYPEQILGFLARMSRIEDRRALQQRAMTALMERIRMAIIQAEIEAGMDHAHATAAWGSLP